MCVDQNFHVSWYALERLALGQLSPGQMEQLEAVCRENHLLKRRRGLISADTRPMPAFHPEQQRAVLRLKMPVLVMACAIAMLLVTIMTIILFRQQEYRPVVESNPAYNGSKGGSLSVSIVRMRDGILSHSPDSFTDADKFKFYVTSPGDGRLTEQVEVVVFQGKDIFFPYKKPIYLHPGNMNELPGSLQFSGNRKIQVCIFTGKHVSSRNRIRSEGMSSLPKQTVCATLKRE